MNFHDDNWIAAKLEEHLQYATQYYDPQYCIGLFLRGSQNYGLDDENSDVDSMLLVCPSIEDICLGRKPVSTTLVMPNTEHIDVKDIRLLQAQILKQSPQFMECLMTPYFLIFNHAQKDWNNLLSHKDDYCNYDRKKMAKAMRGYAHQKHHALSHPYPSRIQYIEKYGYDPKQLMHLVRYKELMKDFALGGKFPDILICDNPYLETYLRELKSGKFKLAAAETVAAETLKVADKYTNLMLEQEPDLNPEKSAAIEAQLQEDVGAFIRHSLHREFSLKENRPMKVKYIHEEYPEHDWKLDKNGEIDLWAWESGFHSGPECKRCYASPCCFCEDEEEWNKGPCIVNKIMCPKCGNENIRTFGFNYKYCPICGTPLDWSDINGAN